MMRSAWKKHKYLFPVASLFALIVIGSLFLVGPNKPYTIELREDGFYPKELSIKKGATITFSTSRQKPFWPASNLHPSHGIYPEFDPKEPIAPADSWSFTFTKAGEWKYHDHLAPVYKGVIEVMDGKTAEKRTGDSACRTSGEDNPLCWQERIDAALASGGAAAAFDAVAALYAQPSFNGDCHDYAHRIGERAYRLYADGENMRLSSKTSYCGYGFYHGFMEALLHDTGSVQDAQKFCARVGAELADESSDAEGACYHGIGHGAVDGGDPRAWGDLYKLMAQAMDMCKAVSDENDTRVGSYFYRCITGVYNALEVLSLDPKYGISNLREDSFSFCAKEPDEYQEPCYTNMTPIVLSHGKGDFHAMIRRLESIQERGDSFSIRAMAISAIFHEFTRAYLGGSTDIARGVRVCQSRADDRSRRACIDGISGGFMKYGEPTKEYVKGLAFCGSPLLAADERDICFQHILTRLRIWYSPEESKRICALADMPYQRYCV